jgi:hypothetical protein
MVWTAPTPRTTGELITASIWNTDLTDNLNALRGGAVAIASQTAGDFIYAAGPAQFSRVGSVAPTYVMVGGNPPSMKLAIGKQSIWIPASAMRPDAVSPCGPLTNIGSQQYAILGYPFDPNVLEIAVHPGIVFPKAFDVGGVTVQIYWTRAGATAGNVYWLFWAVRAYSDGDDLTYLGPDFGGVGVTDTALGTKVLCVASAVATPIGGPPQTGDLVRFNIQRHATDPNDTLPEDAYLLGVMITYNTAALTDD